MALLIHDDNYKTLCISTAVKIRTEARDTPFSLESGSLRCGGIRFYDYTWYTDCQLPSNTATGQVAQNINLSRYLVGYADGMDERHQPLRDQSQRPRKQTAESRQPTSRASREHEADDNQQETHLIYSFAHHCAAIDVSALSIHLLRGPVPRTLLSPFELLIPVPHSSLRGTAACETPLVGGARNLIPARADAEAAAVSLAAGPRPHSGRSLSPSLRLNQSRGSVTRVCTTIIKEGMKGVIPRPVHNSDAQRTVQLLLP